jgi:cysteine desulfurase
VRADKLIMKLPHIALATGSACTSAEDHPSHVLRAMGLTEDEARSCVRISLGATTTEEETFRARQEIRDAVDELMQGL